VILPLSRTRPWVTSFDASAREQYPNFDNARARPARGGVKSRLCLAILATKVNRAVTRCTNNCAIRVSPEWQH
jgi:hypothetical protein